MCWFHHDNTHPFNGPLSRTTWVSRYQKGRTNLDFTGARDSEWQWHQLGHMQVCTLPRQITMPVPDHSVFYRPDALPVAQPTAWKHWRHQDKLNTVTFLDRGRTTLWITISRNWQQLPRPTSHMTLDVEGCDRLLPGWKQRHKLIRFTALWPEWQRMNVRGWWGCEIGWM